LPKRALVAALGFKKGDQPTSPDLPLPYLEEAVRVGVGQQNHAYAEGGGYTFHMGDVQGLPLSPRKPLPLGCLYKEEHPFPLDHQACKSLSLSLSNSKLEPFGWLYLSPLHHSHRLLHGGGMLNGLKYYMHGYRRKNRLFDSHRVCTLLGDSQLDLIYCVSPWIDLGVH
jgi:hypothetical protein